MLRDGLGGYGADGVVLRLRETTLGSSWPCWSLRRVHNLRVCEDLSGFPWFLLISLRSEGVPVVIMAMLDLHRPVVDWR